jgi:hypothetical protein
MSKLRTLTYGVDEGGRDGEPPTKLLEWTDDDRVILHVGPQPAASTWEVPVGDLRRVWGITAWMTFVPGDGDSIRVWFVNPGGMSRTVDTPQFDVDVARSGVAGWATALRAAGVRTWYLSTRGVYVLAFAVIPGLVVVGAVIAAIVASLLDR